MRWTEQPIFFVDFEGEPRLEACSNTGSSPCSAGRSWRRRRACAARPAASGPRTPRSTACGPRRWPRHAPLSVDWDYFAELRERGPLAAHFAGAENSLLKSVWPYPRRSPDFARAGAQVIDWGPWLDSARIYGQLRPQLASNGLEAVIAACGLQPELDALAAAHCPPGRRGYHAALYDALAGALLLAVLARDPRWTDFTVMQWLALSTLDPEKRDGLVQRELW